jgi:hypothetical protein
LRLKVSVEGVLSVEVSDHLAELGHVNFNHVVRGFIVSDEVSKGPVGTEVKDKVKVFGVFKGRL